jgi:hypothetical protein
MIGPAFIVVPEHSAYMRIGQSLWSLVLAYVGGRFARHVWLRRVERIGTSSAVAASTSATDAGSGTA